MTFKRNINFLIACVTSLLSLTCSAQQTHTANVQVKATVDASCTIAANPLDFGKYDPLSPTAKNQSAAVTLTCVKNTPIKSIDLDIGLSPDNGIRRMTNGAEFLKYQVYKPSNGGAGVDIPGAICDANATVAWGSGTDGLHPAPHSDALAKTYNLCGVIDANQDVGAGDYADTLIVTVQL